MTDSNFHIDAFALYVKYKNCAKVAKILKTSRVSINNWRRKEKWEEKIQELVNKALEFEKDDIQNTINRHLKIYKATQSKYANRLINDSKLEISFRDAHDAIKGEQNIKGMTTDTVKVEHEVTLSDLMKQVKGI